MARTPQTSTAAGRLQRGRIALKSLDATIAEKEHGCNRLAEGDPETGKTGLGWKHPLVLDRLDDLADWRRDYAEQLRQNEIAEQDAEQEAQDQARFDAARAEAFAAWQASGGTGRFMFYAGKQQLSTKAETARQRDVVNHRRLRAQRAVKGA